MLDSVNITCPYCWEIISIDVDCSGGSSDYAQDCQVCCNPIRIRIEIDLSGNLAGVSADRENA